MMRILKIFFILIMLLSMHVYAEDNNIVTPIPKKERGPINPGKHKAPSAIKLYFSYNYKNCQSLFTLPCDVEYIDIAAENMESHVFYTGSVSVDNPVWEQPLPVGEYYIECTADNGDIYAGYIYI